MFCEGIIVYGRCDICESEEVPVVVNEVYIKGTDGTYNDIPLSICICSGCLERNLTLMNDLMIDPPELDPNLDD